MPRFERVRLVDFSDRRYRALLARLSTFRKPKGTGPTDRDLFSKDAERILRWWIAQHVNLTKLRIIHFHERTGFLTTEKYRELDGVALAGAGLILFEIKTGRTKAAVRQGLDQLALAREILSASFPSITTCLLIVDTDDVPNSEIATYVSSNDSIRFIGSLDELTSTEHTHVMPFSVADISALAHAPIHLEWRAA